MENKLRKVRTCRVKCILPTDEVKQILLLHSVSTKRLEDKISALSGMVDTNREVSDSDTELLVNKIDKLSDSVLRIGYTCIVALFVSSLCLIASLF